MCPFEAPYSRTALMVREFHEAAHMPAHSVPTLPSRKLMDARIVMAWEEYDEHERHVADFEAIPVHTKAERDRHIADVARELADAVYVAYGTALLYGIDLDRVIAEVHKANMRKVEGPVRKRTDGKVLKPRGWEPPDVRRVLFG